MSKESNILITADLGSFNIKLSSGGIYENRFLLDNRTDVFGYDTITFEDNTYFFGKGSFDKTFIKAKKNILVPLLYALGRDGVSGTINIILHLPSSQMTMKSEIVDQLSNKTFSYIVNGKSATVTFNKVGVLREGFSSFYSLPKRSEGLIVIIDIGGRTTDIFAFEDGKEVAQDSIPMGTFEYFDYIAKELTGRGDQRKMEDIHGLFKRKIITVEEVEHIKNEFFNNLINEIQFKFPHLSDYDIKLCGGGAGYFVDLFENKFKKVSLLPNNVTSNVDGAERIGKALNFDK